MSRRPGFNRDVALRLSASILGLLLGISALVIAILLIRDVLA
jgi:hypothetical protein